MKTVTTALVKALEVCLSQTQLADRRRDAVVNALEDAMQAVSSAPMLTTDDTAALEKLESMVLNLRISGASSAPTKKPFGNSRL